MLVRISESRFDPWFEIQNYQNSILALAGKYGATSIFIGTMRDFNEGDLVTGMTLEHYPGMTEKQLGKILHEAQQQWPLLDAFIIHRVGDVYPNDPIVAVAVWTSHRGDAFDACHFITEALKSKAPFWKKEILTTHQERWVLTNTNGYAAVKR